MFDVQCFHTVLLIAVSKQFPLAIHFCNPLNFINILIIHNDCSFFFHSFAMRKNVRNFRYFVSLLVWWCTTHNCFSQLPLFIDTFYFFLDISRFASNIHTIHMDDGPPRNKTRRPLRVWCGSVCERTIQNVLITYTSRKTLSRLVLCFATIGNV